jgi:hypothetical protein
VEVGVQHRHHDAIFLAREGEDRAIRRGGAADFRGVNGVDSASPSA